MSRRENKGIAMNKVKLAMLGVLVVSTSASSEALAQKAKYTRQQDVKIDVKLSDSTKPTVIKPEDKKAPVSKVK